MMAHKLPPAKHFSIGSLLDTPRCVLAFYAELHAAEIGGLRV